MQKAPTPIAALKKIIAYFAVMLILTIVDIYHRWYFGNELRIHIIIRDANREAHHNNRPNSRLLFNTGFDSSSVPRGQLDPAILASLRVLDYADVSLSLECAVCISEFKTGEKVRLLPKCKHCFRVECIDMWFNSHETCPLCRSMVEKFSARSGAIWKRMMSMCGSIITTVVPPSCSTEFDLECGADESNQQHFAQALFV